MARSLSRRQAAVLGAAVLAGLALAGGGLFAVAGRHALGGDSFVVVAGFPDVGGVEEGTRVRLQGLDAGEVEAVELPEAAGAPVRLRLRLAGRFRRLLGDPATARVQVGSDGVWGGKFVRVLPGRPFRGELPETVVLRAEPAPELTEELGRAAARLHRTLGEAETTFGKVRRGEGTLGRLVQDERLYRELTGAATRANAALDEATETFREVKAAVRELRGGRGTLGQLVKSKQAYDEALGALSQVREMVVSVRQNSDAIKSMPIIRSYVVDPVKLLNRPDCSAYRYWLAEDLLFEPGRAVLTEEGRQRLAEVAEWANGHKEKGSEVVVAAYAAPTTPYEAAQVLTQKQAEVVRDHLTSNYKVHKTGWWFWSKRAVNAVGCGTRPSPIPSDARRHLPASRVEVLVFVPQG